MGGISGIVASSVPVAVFVLGNLLLELQPAIIAAVGAGILVAGWRIARRQRLQPAVSGPARRGHRRVHRVPDG